MSEAASQQRFHRVIIVGSGVGGMQLAYFLRRANVDYVVLERASAAGSFFEQFPTRRTLLSINKLYTGITDPLKNLRWDWNSLLSDEMDLRFGQFDQDFYPHADSLVKYLRDFCDRMKLHVVFGCNVLSVSKNDRTFLLLTTQGEYTCDLLVFATGTPVPFLPNIPGAELAERYGSHDCSIESSRNKAILIIGKGNSAFETADGFLSQAARIHLISPDYLRMAWRSHFPGHLRQINSPFNETFTLKQQNAVLNGRIDNIEHTKDGFAVKITFRENGAAVTYSYDRVILCTGFMFDSTPFTKTSMPALIHDAKLPALTCQWESTNVNGLYFCGSLMQSNDYKKSASAFIHGIRYNARVLSRFLESRLSNRPYPSVAALPLRADVVFDAVFNRIRRTSSLFHMNDSLCDAFVLNERTARLIQYEDVPVKLMAEDPSFSFASRIELRFTFDTPHNPVVRESSFSSPALIHPVLYLFHKGKMVGECHMFEDVFIEWNQEDFGFCFQGVLERWMDALNALLMEGESDSKTGLASHAPPPFSAGRTTPIER
jgi:thioredoxin reductase